MKRDKDTDGWEAGQVTIDEAITQQVVDQFLALELTAGEARAWLAEGNRLGQLRAGLQFAPQGTAFIEGNPLDGPVVAAYRLYGLEGAEPAATVVLADVVKKLLKLSGRNIGQLFAEVNALKEGEAGPAGLSAADVLAVKQVVQHLEGDLALELFEASGKVVTWAK